MKVQICSLVTVLSFIFPSLLFAQFPQMDFPLQVGNRWQYSEAPGYYSESKAVKDTLMQNGLIYTEVQGELFGGFFRKDSSKVFVYSSSDNGESIIYDFSKKTGDTLSLYINGMDTITTTVYEEGISSIFGQQKHYMSFLTKSSSSSGYGIRKITDGFGFTSYNGEVLSYGLSGAVINGNQYGIVLKAADGKLNYLRKYELFQNYPNPFNPNTIIEFYIYKPTNVQIDIYDILGNHNKTILNEFKNTGKYKITFNGENLSSGIYFYSINLEGISKTKSMILLK